MPRTTWRTALTCVKNTYGHDALAARLLLTLAFGTSGRVKLADQGGSRHALIDFGVRGALVTPLGVLLPLDELIVAVALLLPSTAWYGSLRALLLRFVAGIGLNLARGVDWTAAASARSTPPRSTGRHWCATQPWLPWPA
jgi:hypothetical protein